MPAHALLSCLLLSALVPAASGGAWYNQFAWGECYDWNTLLNMRLSTPVWISVRVAPTATLADCWSVAWNSLTGPGMKVKGVQWEQRGGVCIVLCDNLLDPAEVKRKLFPKYGVQFEIVPDPWLEPITFGLRQAVPTHPRGDQTITQSAVNDTVCLFGQCIATGCSLTHTNGIPRHALEMNALLTFPTPVPNTAVPTASPPTSAPPTPEPRPPMLPTPAPLVTPPSACECRKAPFSASDTGLYFCASRATSQNTRTCSPVGPPYLCGNAELRCPNTLAPHSDFPVQLDAGHTCDCLEYLGADATDTVLCTVPRSGGGFVCSLPNSDGLCVAGSKTCTSRRVVRLHISLPSDFWEAVNTLPNIIGNVTGVSREQLELISACPYESCGINGSCPHSVYGRKVTKCTTYNFNAHFSPQRHAAVLQGDAFPSAPRSTVPMWVDFDVNQPEPQRGQTITKLFSNIELAASGVQNPDPSEEYTEIEKWGVTSVISVDMPVVREQESAVIDDEGNDWLLSNIWWVLALAVTTVILGVVVTKKVWFSEVVNFSASRKLRDDDEMPRGMEGCFRTHTGRKKKRKRGSSALGTGMTDDESEMAIDIGNTDTPLTAYQPYPPVVFLGGTGSFLNASDSKGKLRRTDSTSSHSSSSSSGSEPEITI